MHLAKITSMQYLLGK